MKEFVKELPQFKGFGLSDAEWRKLNKGNFFPEFWLSHDDYIKLGYPVPKKDAPVIGILFGREDGYYCIGRNYIEALVGTGARIMFLDYVNHRSQIVECDAIVLPGGAFASPEVFYTDAKTDKLEHPSDRSRAYAECIEDVFQYGIPLLGICAGAQMCAAMRGMKMFRSRDYFESPIEHKSSRPDAHLIWLKEGTPFFELMDKQESVEVNTRHSEFLAPEKIQREELNLKESDKLPMEIYATATDGIPEAWGDMEHGILCVQWHPEDLAVTGNKLQQRLYQWIYDEAAKRR